MIYNKYNNIFKVNLVLKGISKFIKLGLIASTVSIVAGCNGTIHLTSASDAKGYEPVFSGFPLPLFFVASSVQWNEDYAVSAKHTPFLRNVAYTCSTGCDLVFIKRKADNNIPEWRHSVPNEKLTAYGTSPLYVPAKTEGAAMETRLQKDVESNNKKSIELYKLNNMASIMGMSGGPIYGEDGKVVGITLGFVIKTLMSDEKLTKTPELIKPSTISYMMQTEIIEREWKLFQEQEKNKNI
jgi:hypothetical protein